MTLYATNNALGNQVRDHLIKVGVETPMDPVAVAVDSIQKKEKMEQHFFEIWKTLGMDMTDDSLCETPRRMAKMFVDEIFYGLDYSKFPKCTTVVNKVNYDEMILVNASVMSTCEHHGVTIAGSARVAYIPKDKVLGLSKINRIVEFLAKRPQIQERLTMQIYHALSFILGTDDVAVVIDAEHYCVKSRGVCDLNSSTVTSKLGGVFASKPSTRSEFMAFVNKPKVA